MHTTKHFPVIALAIGLSVMAVGCGCGGAEEHAEGDGTSVANTDGTAATGTTGADGHANGGGSAVGASGDSASREGGVGTMDPNEIRINGSAVGSPAYNERYAASKDVRGFRAQLMAELDAIRTRLKDGTRPADAAKADQTRAADLAQGLERMDRLIKAVEESDDLTWTSVRESSLKEAGEVRAWAVEHGYKAKS